MKWEINCFGKVFYESNDYFISNSSLEKKEVKEVLDKMFHDCSTEYESNIEFTVQTYYQRNLCSDEDCNCEGWEWEEYTKYSFLYVDGLGIYVENNYSSDISSTVKNELEEKIKILLLNNNILIEQNKQNNNHIKKEIFNENKEEEYKKTISKLVEDLEKKDNTIVFLKKYNDIYKELNDKLQETNTKISEKNEILTDKIKILADKIYVLKNTIKEDILK